MYALFKGNEQISKAHSSQSAAATEAFERGLLIKATGDFSDLRAQVLLVPDYEIREVQE